MRALRDQGGKCAVVEHFNPHVGEHGIRQDLFGILDVLVLDPSGVIGIQCCAGSAFKKHWEKLTVERAQDSIDWLSTPGTKLQIWGWRKVKLARGGKAMRWSARVEEVTMGDIVKQR
jgi:hypothetical protein